MPARHKTDHQAQRVEQFLRALATDLDRVKEPRWLAGGAARTYRALQRLDERLRDTLLLHYTVPGTFADQAAASRDGRHNASRSRSTFNRDLHKAEDLFLAALGE